MLYFKKGCRQPGEETRPGVKPKPAADIVRLVFVREQQQQRVDRERQ